MTASLSTFRILATITLLALSGRLVVGRWAPISPQSLSGGNSDTRVGSVELHAANRLDALVQIGEITGIPLAIEYVDDSLLDRSIDVSVRNQTVANVLKNILSDGSGYSWSDEGGVIFISNNLERRPAQRRIFDHRIPSFQARAATAEELSNLLWMDLQIQLQPSPPRGFAGTFPTGDQRKLGRFDLRERSVIQILNEIVRRFGRAAWIAKPFEGSPDSPLTEVPWGIVFYETPPKHLSELCCFVTAAFRQNPVGH